MNRLWEGATREYVHQAVLVSKIALWAFGGMAASHAMEAWNLHCHTTKHNLEKRRYRQRQPLLSWGGRSWCFPEKECAKASLKEVPTTPRSPFGSESKRTTMNRCVRPWNTK